MFAAHFAAGLPIGALATLATDDMTSPRTFCCGGDPNALVQWLLIPRREPGELVRRYHRNNLGLFAKP